MPITVVHAADLHIDSPLTGLARYEGAPWEAVLSATRAAFRRLIQLCLDREAKLLLLAGDLFDGSWGDFNTALFFAAEIVRLREIDCQVVLLRGNHDAQSQIEHALPRLPHVHELHTKRAEVKRYERLGISVTGQGFATRAVVTDLAAGYPDADPHEFSIALLHTSLDGRQGHDNYAPTKLATLLDKGYSYWALGHVHQHEEVHPRVVFPGNLQGRHVRETGPKGAMVLKIDGLACTRREHIALDVVRWEHLHIDVSDARSCADAIDLVSEQVRATQAEIGHTLATRVTLRGATPAPLARDAEELLAQLRASLLGEPVYLEKLRVRTEETRRAAHPLLPYLVQTTPELQTELDAALADLPRELRQEVQTAIGDPPEWLRQVLREVSQRLGGEAE